MASIYAKPNTDLMSKQQAKRARETFESGAIKRNRCKTLKSGQRTEGKTEKEPVMVQGADVLWEGIDQPIKEEKDKEAEKQQTEQPDKRIISWRFVKWPVDKQTKKGRWNGRAALYKRRQPQ